MVISWFQPTLFHFFPKPFNNVEMWRIGRQVKNEQAPFLPSLQKLFDFTGSVDSCIIQNHESEPGKWTRTIHPKIQLQNQH